MLLRSQGLVEEILGLLDDGGRGPVVVSVVRGMECLGDLWVSAGT
jgi:hypothetical protein